MSEIKLNQQKFETASIIPIKIILNTNIPNSHIIEFTSNLLYNPTLNNKSDLEKYPLFTNLYKYDEQIIMNDSYDKIVNFFFNKKTFLDKITTYGKLSNITNANENNLHNIMVMLKSLFHINNKIIEQPISNSYENTYDSSKNDNETGLGQQTTSFIQDVFNKDNIKNVFNKSNSDYYTYITINGEKYTFQRIIWLNDLKTHPFYRKLVNEYTVFNRWLNSTKGKKFKQILDNNSFETIENKYNEESKYGKFYGYFNKQNNENNENNTNNEKKDKNENNKMMISLYSQPEFKKFHQILKTYQDKESKNDLLQQTIETTVSGISQKSTTSIEHNIIGILRNLLNNNEENEDNENNIANEYYYTDVLDDTKNDNYEITILADFIKGEMNDEKYKKVKCDFESDKLGRFLEEKILVDKQTIENKNKNTIFSIDDNKFIDVKYNDTEKQDKMKGELQNEKNNRNNKIGGKRKYTTKKKWKRRTTKKNIHN